MSGGGSGVLTLICAAALAGCQATPPDARAPQATQPTPRPPAIAEGTALSVKLEASVSTATARVGDAVVGKLTQPLLRGEQVVAPEGTEIRGRVMTAERPVEGKRGARLVVEFEQVVLASGPLQIDASEVELPAEGSPADRDIELAAGSLLQVKLHHEALLPR